MIMLFSPFYHIPEWFTGLIGAVIIVSSLIWSIRVNPKGISGALVEEKESR
jgi:hypothetical protein